MAKNIAKFPDPGTPLRQPFSTRYFSIDSAVLNFDINCEFYTDKMPLNFLFIPLICAAYPEAKIIHVQRDPKATCWSNFKHYFVSNDLGYSYDLKDIITYLLRVIILDRARLSYSCR